MPKTTSQSRKQKRKRKGESDKPMLFSEKNYKVMFIGICMVLLGFLAMYIENQEKGIIALYFSPIIIVAGFAILAYGVIKKDINDTEPGITTTSKPVE